jgi:two-component system, NtrC family, sensor kinase
MQQFESQSNHANPADPAPASHACPAHQDVDPKFPALSSDCARLELLESELASLKLRGKDLMQQASMAEVASTALHNMGNVLTSVNVSASVIAQRLRESRIQNLSKALGLLREHKSDLAKFLAEDPKGRMLPGYLETLAEHLIAEHTDALREMEALTHSLEHMKEIVGLQQSYAKRCGFLETLQPAELVEDALRMNWAAFERHGVSIVRQFSPTDPVTVDKHKVLQILVNLIRNAKYAMDESGNGEKILTLEIRPKTGETLAINVRDNGIGISPANLERIFEHGFTTKRDGHGFGLHSGITAALEMGGNLTAHSNGIGTGATFCLELPFSARTNQLTEHARGNTSHLNRI